MDVTQRLIEREALKDLKARYFLYIDTKIWDSWLALFTADATLRYDRAVSTGGRDGDTVVFVGIDEIRTNVIGSLENAVSVHQGHTPLFDFVSDSEATGIWAMEDIVQVDGVTRTHAYGHYRERYVKQDGEWLIRALHLTRTHVAIPKQP